ncbi:unnamed protein product [Arctogadus glacialis]
MGPQGSVKNKGVREEPEAGPLVPPGSGFLEKALQSFNKRSRGGGSISLQTVSAIGHSRPQQTTAVQLRSPHKR